MTREDQFIGRLEDYLDSYEGITPLPDAVRNAVRAALPRTKQAGPSVGLARFSGMSNGFKVGIAAVVIGVAALIGFSLYNAQIGIPDESDSTPTPEAPSALVPIELRHPYLGPQRPIGGTTLGDRANLEFTATAISLETGAGKLFESDVAIVGPGLMQLTARNGSGCEVGTVGTYPYQTSPGGSLLTIDAGTDACADRGDGLVGTWQRSDCRDPGNWCLGRIEAGTYSSQYFEPRPRGTWEARYGALTFTVPDGWAAYTDFPDNYGLTTASEYEAAPDDDCFDCPSTRDALTLLGNPRAATPDCQEAFQAEIGGSAAELAAYLTDHRGLVTTDPADTTVNGLPAIELEIEPAADWTGTCGDGDSFVAVPVFYRQDSFHWALPAGDRWHVTLVDLGDGNTVAIVADSDPETLDAWVAETAPIVDSFEFAPH